MQRCVYLYIYYNNRVYLHGYCSLLFIILIIYSLSLSLVSVISPHSPFLHLIKSSSIAADHLLLAADKSSSHANRRSSNHADHRTTLIFHCRRSSNHADQIIKRRPLRSSNHADQIIKSSMCFGLGG